MFYFCYAILVLILASVLTKGEGCLGFFLYFMVSMTFPVIGPLYLAYFMSRGNAANHIRFTILMHILAACIFLLICILSIL